jgi:hypothetical protein
MSCPRNCCHLRPDGIVPSDRFLSPPRRLRHDADVAPWTGSIPNTKTRSKRVTPETVAGDEATLIIRATVAGDVPPAA